MLNNQPEFINKCMERGLIKTTNIGKFIHLTPDNMFEFAVMRSDLKIMIFVRCELFKGTHKTMRYREVSVIEFMDKFSDRYRDLIKLIIFHIGEFR